MRVSAQGCRKQQTRLAGPWVLQTVTKGATTPMYQVSSLYSIYEESLLNQNFPKKTKTEYVAQAFFNEYAEAKKNPAHPFHQNRQIYLERFANNYIDKLITLFAFKYLLKDKEHRRLSAEALDICMNKILECRDVKGIVWKITKTGLPTHYLIGTVHHKLPNLWNSRGMLEAVNSSRTFYTEVGFLELSFFDKVMCRLFGDSEKAMDLRIASRAISNGATVYSLDNMDEYKSMDHIQNPKMSIKTKTFALDFPTSEGDLGYIVTRISGLLQDKSLEFLNLYKMQNLRFWEKGCVEGCLRDVNNYEPGVIQISNSRTLQWLDRSYKSVTSDEKHIGLREALNSATDSVCIAVGLFHCTGTDDSLIEEFEKDGFDVKRCE